MLFCVLNQLLLDVIVAVRPSLLKLPNSESFPEFHHLYISDRLRITFTVFLRFKLIISQIMENDQIMIACAKIILIDKPDTNRIFLG